MDISIIHDEKNRRFEMHVDGLTPYLSYTASAGVIAYEHTVVPPALSGRGLASRLTKHALDYARERGLKVRPVCSFIAAYIDKHPEYRALSLYHSGGE